MKTNNSRIGMARQKKQFDDSNWGGGKNSNSKSLRNSQQVDKQARRQQRQEAQQNIEIY